MMIKIDLQEAQGRLEQLLDEATHGEDVFITRQGGQTYRIVPFPTPKPKPVFGSARGSLRIREDFDAPLEDFQDYEP